MRIVRPMQRSALRATSAQRSTTRSFIARAQMSAVAEEADGASLDDVFGPFGSKKEAQNLQEENSADTKPESVCDDIFLQEKVDKKMSGSRSELAKQIWRASKRSCRDKRVYSALLSQLSRQLPYIGPEDIVLVFYSLARVQFRDVKFLKELGFHALRSLDHFSPMGVAILMNAHKRLELGSSSARHMQSDCGSNLVLLMQRYLCLSAEWQSWDVSLVANTCAYYHIYEQRLWKGICAWVGTKGTISFGPQSLTLLISALARLDWRDARCLLKLARLCERGNEEFSTTKLTTVYGALCKLDFAAAKLFSTFEARIKTQVAAQVREESTVQGFSEEETNCPKSEKEEEFNFFPHSDDVVTKETTVPSTSVSRPLDVQAQIVFLFSFVCFTKGASRDPGLVRDLVWLVSRRAKYLRKDTSEKIAMVYHFLSLQESLKSEFETELSLLSSLLQGYQKKHQEGEKLRDRDTPGCARWTREVFRLLTEKLRVSVSHHAPLPFVSADVCALKGLVGSLSLSGKTAVFCLGAYSYYANTTQRTSFSKLKTKLLEEAGYAVLHVPYYEWAELRLDEDKALYMVSKGREAAGCQ